MLDKTCGHVTELVVNLLISFGIICVGAVVSIK